MWRVCIDGGGGCGGWGVVSRGLLLLGILYCCVILK